MSRKIEGFGDIRDDLATRKFNRLGFLLSGRSEVQILLATLRKMPKILEIQSFRHFTISKFANQNGVSANCPKNFVKKLANWKGGSFQFKFVTSSQVRAVENCYVETIYYISITVLLFQVWQYICFALFFCGDGEITAIPIEKYGIYCKKAISVQKTWFSDLEFQV